MWACVSGVRDITRFDTLWCMFRRNVSETPSYINYFWITLKIHFFNYTKKPKVYFLEYTIISKNCIQMTLGSSWAKRLAHIVGICYCSERERYLSVTESRVYGPKYISFWPIFDQISLMCWSQVNGWLGNKMHMFSTFGSADIVRLTNIQWRYDITCFMMLLFCALWSHELSENIQDVTFYLTFEVINYAYNLVSSGDVNWRNLAHTQQHLFSTS